MCLTEISESGEVLNEGDDMQWVSAAGVEDCQRTKPFNTSLGTILLTGGHAPVEFFSSFEASSTIDNFYVEEMASSSSSSSSSSSEAMNSIPIDLLEPP
jgi:hypothetical protein